MALAAANRMSLKQVCFLCRATRLRLSTHYADIGLAVCFYGPPMTHPEPHGNEPACRPSGRFDWRRVGIYYRLIMRPTALECTKRKITAVSKVNSPSRESLCVPACPHSAHTPAHVSRPPPWPLGSSLCPARAAARGFRSLRRGSRPSRAVPPSVSSRPGAGAPFWCARRPVGALLVAASGRQRERHRPRSPTCRASRRRAGGGGADFSPERAPILLPRFAPRLACRLASRRVTQDHRGFIYSGRDSGDVGPAPAAEFTPGFGPLFA